LALSRRNGGQPEGRREPSCHVKRWRSNVWLPVKASADATSPLSFKALQLTPDGASAGASATGGGTVPSDHKAGCRWSQVSFYARV